MRFIQSLVIVQLTLLLSSWLVGSCVQVLRQKQTIYGDKHRAAGQRPPYLTSPSAILKFYLGDHFGLLLQYIGVALMQMKAKHTNNAPNKQKAKADDLRR